MTDSNNSAGTPAARADLILSQIQSLNERDLTQDIIMPLMAQVEYFGGPNERGKDVLCWYTNELDETALAVAQVKLSKASAKARDTESLSELVTQLSQANEEPVKHKDGFQYRPTSVLFITPFEIDSRALETRFRRFKSLRTRNRRIIDGRKLVNLIEKHLPELAAQYLGVEHHAAEVTQSYLTNEVLLAALNQQDRARDIRHIYTDIDFSLGKHTTRLLRA